MQRNLKLILNIYKSEHLSSLSGGSGADDAECSLLHNRHTCMSVCLSVTLCADWLFGVTSCRC